MVPTVCHSGVEDDHYEPQPGHRDMGPHHNWTKNNGHQVHDDMFKRVAINRGYSDGRNPLVMSLVDVLVEEAMMTEPTAGSSKEGAWVEKLASSLNLSKES